MPENYSQCIIVGGGPAGTAAAYTLAKAGVNTIVVERGKVPGSKNLFGGVLCSNVLNSIIPDFRKTAPLERTVVRRKYFLLNDDSELSIIDLYSKKFHEKPDNNSYTLSRRYFDEWFAGVARQEGVEYLNGTRVDSVLIDDEGKVVGIEALGDRLYSDVVILADGSNSMLAKQCGLRESYDPKNMSLGVKELISMPREKIEDRFNLEDGEGASFMYMGDVVRYTPGGAFVATNRDSISIGVVMRLADIAKGQEKPYEVLEHFKKHPGIRRLLCGGNLDEYSAHLMPKMGYYNLPQFSADGIMVIGDAAGLMNEVFQEGMNLAMASGVMAGMTVIEAIMEDDYSDVVLKRYREKLEKSFVLKDIKKYSGFHSLADNSKKFFDVYVKDIIKFATRALSITDRSKEEQIDDAWKDFKSNHGWSTLIKDGYKLWSVMH